MSQRIKAYSLQCYTRAEKENSVKALKEIGFKKALRYVLFSFALMLFDIFVFVSPLRVMFLRLFGARIGNDCVIHKVSFLNCYRMGFKGLMIKDSCFIGKDCLLDLADRIILEDNVTLAERVNIITHLNVGYKDHPLQAKFESSSGPVIIKRGSYIGTGTTILHGVEVGQRSFIAAGSIVTRNIPSDILAGGVPAKKIREL